MIGAAAGQVEQPRDESPLDLLSYPLMPADPARRGVIVEAPPNWRFDPGAFDPRADVVVWGRMSDRTSHLKSAAGRAALREATLLTMHQRIPSHMRLVAVHRLPPRQLETGGLRSSVRAAVRGGALVELNSLPVGARILDGVLVAAEVRRSQSDLYAGAGGAMLKRVVLADGSHGLLRLAREGAPGDPARSADTLERITRAGVPVVPRVIARGHRAGASWVVEQALPGRRPARVTGGLAQQVAELCAAFPRGDGPPLATEADLSDIAARLPDRANSVGKLATDISGMVRSLPSILRHGDLWAGNLLVDRGTLSGLIDWDAAHPAAIPGTDLLQLSATEFRRRAHRELGPAFLRRPWRLPMFSQVASGYWAALGIRPDDALLDVVAIGWWATEVHGTLARLPHRATDTRWVATNVDPVLDALGF